MSMQRSWTAFKHSLTIDYERFLYPLLEKLYLVEVGSFSENIAFTMLGIKRTLLG
jgi:hypothetical protein